MKTLTICLFLLLLTSSAFGELTKDDLRTILKEEINASEKRTREYINLKIDGLDKSLNARIDALDQRIDDVGKNLNARINDVEKNLNTRIGDVEKNLNIRIDDINNNFSWVWLVLLALIAAAVGLPQLIIIYTEKRLGRETRSEIQQLREKIEAMENASS